MKYLLLTISLFMLSACGGGDSDEKAPDTNNLPGDTNSFTLQNIRFDAKDFYEGELVTVTKGTNFEVQWVSPSSASYRIDLYLSANGAEHSDNNKIVGLKCGGASLSLCPNATGEVQCGIDDNKLSCSIGSDFLGSENFLEQNISSLKFIIKGCDANSNCDVKTFDLLVQNKTDD
ncbi:hypothetical protein ACM9HF_14510 [Colwellia sp. RE-S-Sl-9]